jgi:hypothetical protein
MTPQEQQLVDELFDRLARLENSPRDPDAERIIADGVRQAPHATYALVQTALGRQAGGCGGAVETPARRGLIALEEIGWVSAFT